MKNFTAQFYASKNGFLAKITNSQGIYGWINYDSLTNRITDEFKKAIQDAAGQQSAGKVIFSIEMNSEPETMDTPNGLRLDLQGNGIKTIGDRL